MHTVTQTESKCYAGIHYLDVIANNQRNQGQIIDVTFKEIDHFLEVTIKTDYAYGLTITNDILTYENKLLIDWSIVFSDGYSQNIFCRKLYNNVLNKKKNI